MSDRLYPCGFLKRGDAKRHLDSCDYCQAYQDGWQAALRRAAEVCRREKLDCIFVHDNIREDCAQAIEREAGGE